jgi:dienelactone hydrolase
VRRRTLLLGLAASATGAAGALAATPAAAGRPSAAGVFASTRTSSLLPRRVSTYLPPDGTPPAAVPAIDRHDYLFARAGRQLHTRVWHPVGPGRYPVVIFSHGLHSQPDDYATMLAGWARAGFVVAAPLYPHTSLGAAAFNAYDIANQPADASAVLSALLARSEQAGPLHGRLDPERVAAAGHSAGAITTAGLFSAGRDARLKAGVLLAGTDFLGTPFSGPAAAMLVVHGRNDDTVSYAAARTVYRAVPWSRAMLTVSSGGHQTSAAELPAVSGTIVAFLRWSLYGGTPELAAPAALGSVATLDAQLSAR